MRVREVNIVLIFFLLSMFQGIYVSLVFVMAGSSHSLCLSGFLKATGLR